MRKARLHNEYGCQGALVRVYERPERTGSVSPIGYICSVCREFVPDRSLAVNLGDLRPAVEAMASEISVLLLDRQVQERFAGIVRSNGALLSAAQAGNPYLSGVRRWWATSAALVLRRHLEGGSGSTLRDVLEALVNLPDGNLSRPRDAFIEDLQKLEKIAERFRPYLNGLIHGMAANVADATLVYSDLNDAISFVGAAAERAYVAVANISRRMDPVIQFDWTEIFERAWVESDTEMAYVLGEEGVPFDALPLTLADANKQARLSMRIEAGPDESVKVMVSNTGAREALDVRVFLPYAGTVVDVTQLAPQEEIDAIVVAPLVGSVSGQSVLEFSDIHDNVYRQYADVVLSSCRVRRLSPVPFRVSGRIVAASRRKAAGQVH